jgi:hypothetical protein
MLTVDRLVVMLIQDGQTSLGGGDGVMGPCCVGVIVTQSVLMLLYDVIDRGSLAGI